MKTNTSIGRRPVVFLALLFALLTLSASLFAEAEFKTVRTDELKTMLREGKPLTLIDSRTPQEYQDAHIKGAISIPEKEFQEKASLLPVDKAALLIVYCNGVKCGKSKRPAMQLEPLGYSNILIYSEGFPVWEERMLPIVTGPDYGNKIDTRKLGAPELKQMIDSKSADYVLVDVRDTAEFSDGHIPTAINIPAETFASGAGDLPKDKKIIVYCNTGSRSYLAYRKLMGLSYTNIYQTLMADWREAGLSAEK